VVTGTIYWTKSDQLDEIYYLSICAHLKCGEYNENKAEVLFK
jgi:hypothetical protein